MAGSAQVVLEPRMWFNDANSSTWFFLPGLIMLIVTLVGIMLTAIVMAREWERGTFESLFVTPVRPLELILAKIIPYFCVAMVGVFLCLFFSRFLFEVPLVGLSCDGDLDFHDLSYGCPWHRACHPLK